MKGMIFDIKRFAVNDGPGVRTTVFLKGCPLACCWCHNPEGRSWEIETIVSKKMIGNEVINKEKETGRTVKANDLMKEILKDKIFFEESAGGVTFSGGEPIMQYEFLLAMLKSCKKAGIHIIVDTCGHVSADALLEIASFTDLFLFDVKLMNRDLHKKYTGVSNDLILSNLKLLLSSGAKVVIRIPVIRGINDTRENVDGLIHFLDRYRNHLAGINLLNYHSMAKSKYERLGIKKRTCLNFQPGDVGFLKKQLESNRFMVKID